MKLDRLGRSMDVTLPPADSLMLMFSDEERKAASDGLAVLAARLEAAGVKSDDVWNAFLFFRELIVKAERSCPADKSADSWTVDDSSLFRHRFSPA